MKYRQLLILMTAFIISLAASGRCGAVLSEDDQACLGCHEAQQSMTFKNGDILKLKVTAQDVEKSVHGTIGCSACHGFTAENHQRKSYKNKKEFSALAARQCLQCHSTLDNPIHKKLMGESGTGAICTDCHGSHRIKRVRELARGNQYCLTCHGKEMTLTYKNGEKATILVQESVLNASVHKNLSCVDCHVRVSAESHPLRDFRSKRDFMLVMADNCRRCHFDKYAKTLEGIHFKVMSQGNTHAPVCTDCHGSHAIASARKDRLANAKKCEQCHSAVYAVYAKSVHGAALIDEHIEDVPICSDCHKAHDNAGPHTADFRISVPQTCAGCHEKKEIMQKYGLSTKVVDTYLQDFHGVTMKFYRQFGKTDKQIAVCIDCHGVHDIARVKSGNAAIVKQNLTKRCQKCHPGATANFPDSWISHYEPNFSKAPMVFMIDWGYRMFIPFMIVGLLLQIFLHIWRYIVNR
ncbi:MAG: cytochrome c3 family protein [Nitrospirae bacterium]|nr:cytochrome c3 family protein [Nitrospirota bacterium]